MKSDEKTTEAESALDEESNLELNSEEQIEALKLEVDKYNEQFMRVVADFDNEKIVVKTDAEAEKDPEMDFDNQGSTDVVKKMAKSAMNRRK